MQLKERAVEYAADEVQLTPPTSDSTDRGRQATAFVAAGRAAIARALSNDSQQYLAQNQQKGGE